MPISTTNEDIKIDVTLFEQTQNLEEVELVYEIPITIKGDTIVYNTDSFVSGTEKKLADQEKVKNQDLISNELYFLVLSNGETTSLKKILFRP